MNVGKIMTRKLITVRPVDSVEDAVQLLRQRGVRHLLVVDKPARLVGIVSDRDIKRALEPSKTKKRVIAVGGFFFLMEPILVEEIMTRRPVTISPRGSVVEAARIMIDRKFGALPVVDEQGGLVGIVTETDVLRYFCHDASPTAAPGQPRRKSAPARTGKKPPRT